MKISLACSLVFQSLSRVIKQKVKYAKRINQLLVQLRKLCENECLESIYSSNKMNAHKQNRSSVVFS